LRNSCLYGKVMLFVNDHYILLSLAMYDVVRAKCISLKAALGHENIAEDTI